MGLFPELDQVKQRSGGGSSLFPELKKPAGNGKGNYLMDSAANALKNTPIGMAVNATGSVINAASHPLIDIPREAVSPITAVTTRPARAVGVMASEAMQYPFQPSAEDYTRAISEGRKAYQPGYQPSNARNAVGAMVGEGAAVTGLGLIPAVGPELATTAGVASNIERTGGVSLADIAGIGSMSALSATRVINRLGLTEKLLPALLKSQKGLPLEVTKMALKDPALINKVSTAETMHDRTQAIIDAFKEARKTVGEEYGKTYKEVAGMNNPVDEYINDLPGNRPTFTKARYEVPGEEVTKTHYVPGRTYRTVEGVENRGINPNEVTGQSSGEVSIPGRSYSYKAEGPNKTVSDTRISGTTPFREAGPSMDDLKAEYHAAKDGSLFKKRNPATGSFTEMSDQEKLVKLTELKRNIKAATDYIPAGQEVGKSQGVINTGNQKMATEIDALRSKIPGGDKLAVADEAYNEMQAIKNKLETVLRDTGSQQDYLNRLLKGNIDWLTAGRNGAKVEAIKRIEEITGKKVLQPALEELASAYINSPDILSLPSFQTSKIIAALFPTKEVIRAAIKVRDIGGKVAPRYGAAALGSLGLVRKDKPVESIGDFRE